MYSTMFKSAVKASQAKNKHQANKNRRVSNGVTQPRKNRKSQQPSSVGNVNSSYSYEKWAVENASLQHIIGKSTQTYQSRQVRPSIKHDKPSKAKDEVEEQVAQDYFGSITCLFCGGFCHPNGGSTTCLGYGDNGEFNEDVTDPLAQLFEEESDDTEQWDEPKGDRLGMSIIDTEGGMLPMIYGYATSEEMDAEYLECKQMLQPLTY